MNFGVPNLRVAKQVVEKYPNQGVITLLETAPKKARKFEFNKKALELLGLASRKTADAKLEQIENASVAFSFDGLDILIANTTGLTGIKEVGLTNTGTISDKGYYDFIKKLINKGENEEVELFMQPTESNFNNFPVFKLSIDGLQEEEPVTVSEQVSGEEREVRGHVNDGECFNEENELQEDNSSANEQEVYEQQSSSEDVQTETETSLFGTVNQEEADSQYPEEYYAQREEQEFSSDINE